ncbi:phage head closure protein [Streptomyces sp. WMMC897]|uniref:phage head closure protein n=1 Tax=Streptomyces sp. WMMC897 TaxID=3014782 RepID=UPI0022B726C5|nr:phage head closure protein [Streptomyces sp. WMMC897]MCZ7414312.1 phage head closure protein [Streptomyces sp. WMMC897]
MIGHLLNRSLQVWRPTTTPDGAGGQVTTLVQLPDPVAAKVDQPTDTERMVAAQARSDHDHSIYLLPTADVRRGDELRGDGQTFRVLAVVTPSAPRYRKAECQLTQTEGEPDG